MMELSRTAAHVPAQFFPVWVSSNITWNEIIAAQRSGDSWKKHVMKIPLWPNNKLHNISLHGGRFHQSNVWADVPRDGGAPSMFEPVSKQHIQQHIKHRVSYSRVWSTGDSTTERGDVDLTGRPLFHSVYCPCRLFRRGSGGAYCHTANGTKPGVEAAGGVVMAVRVPCFSPFTLLLKKTQKVLHVYGYDVVHPLYNRRVDSAL